LLAKDPEVIIPAGIKLIKNKFSEMLKTLIKSAGLGKINDDNINNNVITIKQNINKRVLIELYLFFKILKKIIPILFKLRIIVTNNNVSNPIPDLFKKIISNKINIIKINSVNLDLLLDISKSKGKITAPDKILANAPKALEGYSVKPNIQSYKIMKKIIM
tara:strand:+ start:329 stop:811 length:483 start_codon:yes stop_codon:yes gene_type:complete